MATIAANSFLVELSADSGTTWKSVVCEESSSGAFDTTTNSRVTKCGTFTTSSEQTASVEYNGVVKSDPDADELSYEQVMAYWLAQTSLVLRRENPSGGANLYQKMSGTITNMSDASDAGDLVGFTFTFTCNDSSTIDFTP